MSWATADNNDGDATEKGLRSDELRRTDVVVAVVEDGDCDNEDGERERKLWLGFWLCEGERVMRCHSMIGYFSEWRIADVASFNWLF